MKKPCYHYNASGMPVDEAGYFQSLKEESVETLRHRKKLLQADLWRNKRIRQAQVQNGQRPAEELPELEQAAAKTMKAIQRINTELNHRKGKE